MAYQINYSAEKVSRRNIKYIKISSWYVVIFILLITLVAGHIILDCDFKHSMHMLFPWTDPQTREAFTVMEKSLYQGVPLKEVLHTFCEDIVSPEVN